MLTNGFIPSRLADHFQSHGSEFKARDEKHYEQLADIFIGGKLRTDCEQCIRPNGDIVRFSRLTGEFGAMTKTRYIKTYFIADPTWHHRMTNDDYFDEQC